MGSKTPDFVGATKKDNHAKTAWLSYWCEWRDLNPYVVRRQILSLVRLPFRHTRRYPSILSRFWAVGQPKIVFSRDIRAKIHNIWKTYCQGLPSVLYYAWHKGRSFFNVGWVPESDWYWRRPAVFLYARLVSWRKNENGGVSWYIKRHRASRHFCRFVSWPLPLFYRLLRFF